MESGTIDEIQRVLPPERAGTRQWMGLWVLTLPCLLYSMDVTVLNLAIPTVSADLRPTAAQMLWILDIYGFVVAGLLITMGKLGDRIGRRRLLLLGAGLFGIASLCAAFSTSASMLIVARGTLGIAGATFAPSTLGLIRTLFPGATDRATAIALWVSSFSVGSALGPLVGGVLLQYFWWGSVFLIAVPLMALLLIVGPKVLPEYRDSFKCPIDLLSSVMSLFAVVAGIYGVKQIAEYGFAAVPVASTAVGLLIAHRFIRRQRRLPSPMVDLMMFRRPLAPTALMIYALASFASVGMFVLVSQSLQLLLKLSPFESAVRILPIPLIFILGSIVAPLLARRFGSVRILAVGLTLAAVGIGLLALLGIHSTLALTLLLCLYSAGLAPVFPIAIQLIVSTFPPRQAGTASAVSETVGELGSALGIALLGSISTAIFRVFVADALPSAVVGETKVNTLSGYIDLAHKFGGSIGTEILLTAQAAFDQGIKGAALVTATALLIAAVWILRFRRNHGRQQTVSAGTLRELHGPARESMSGEPDR
jgi:MFS transporter, DHA2 family, multidrug resistance protein